MNSRKNILLVSLLLVFLFVMGGLLLGGVLYYRYEYVAGRVTLNPDGTIPEPWLKRTHQTIYEENRHSLYGGQTATEYWVYEYYPDRLPAPGRDTRAAIRAGKYLKNNSHFDEYHFGLAACLAKAKRSDEAKKVFLRIKDDLRKDQCIGVCVRHLAQANELSSASAFIDLIQTESFRGMAIGEAFEAALKFDSEDSVLLELANQLPAGYFPPVDAALSAGRVDLALQLFGQFSLKTPKIPASGETQLPNVLLQQASMKTCAKLIDALCDNRQFDQARSLLRGYGDQMDFNQTEAAVISNTDWRNRILVKIAVSEIKSGNWKPAVDSVRNIPDNSTYDHLHFYQSIIIAMAESDFLTEATALALEWGKEKANGRTQFFDSFLSRLLELQKIREAGECLRSIREDFPTYMHASTLVALVEAEMIDDAVSLAKNPQDYSVLLRCLLDRDMVEQAIVVAETVSPLSAFPSRYTLFAQIIEKLSDSGTEGAKQARDIFWRFPGRWDEVLTQLPDIQNEQDENEQMEIRHEMGNHLCLAHTMLNNLAWKMDEPVTPEEYRRLAALGTPDIEICIALLKAGDRENANVWFDKNLEYYKKPLINTFFIGSLMDNGLKEDAIRFAKKEMNQNLFRVIVQHFTMRDQFDSDDLKTAIEIAEEHDPSLFNILVESLAKYGHFQSALEIAEPIPVIATDPNTGKQKADTALRDSLFQSIRGNIFDSPPEGYAKIREIIWKYPIAWSVVFGDESPDEETVRLKYEEIEGLQLRFGNMHQRTWDWLSYNAELSQQPLTSAEYKKLAAFGLPNEELLKKMLYAGEKEAARELAKNAQLYHQTSDLLRVLESLENETIDNR